MRKEDLGYDPVTGRHDQRLTRTEGAFLGCLWLDHIGEDNLISANALAEAFAAAMGCAPPTEDDLNDFVAGWKRDVRYMQNHLLFAHDRIPVYSRAGKNGGYWIGESEQEGFRFDSTFRKRALTGMKKAHRGRQAVIVELVQQLSFEFDDPTDDEAPPARAVSGRPTPIAVVDAFMEQMARNPERFSDDLYRLGQKFGTVLLPKGRIEEIGSAARRLQELVRELV